MYEQFYRLREMPFSLTPDPTFLYPSPEHRFALTLLRYGVVSRAGFSLLSGEVGSGKTILIRQLLAGMEADVSVGLIHNTSRQFGRMLQWICLALGIEHQNRNDAALYQAFLDHVVREYAAGRRVVLIVDEAQNLGVDALEELRVLSNVNADKHMVLQTILVGQPELRQTLQLPELQQFAQRISVDYHLSALSLHETYSYVRHRLRVAGGNPDLISLEAVDLVHDASAGIPRLINQLCDTALVYGFAEQQPSIDAELMTEVVSERMAGGVFPANGAFAALQSPRFAPTGVSQLSAGSRAPVTASL